MNRETGETRVQGFHLHHHSAAPQQSCLLMQLLLSGNDPSRRPNEDEMYRIWTQVRVTLETLAALHGETPKEMAVQALELAPNGEEWAKRYASWVEAAREELGRATSSLRSRAGCSASRGRVRDRRRELEKRAPGTLA